MCGRFDEAFETLARNKEKDTRVCVFKVDYDFAERSFAERSTCDWAGATVKF
jgi:hypothetical protein